jgi:hypothetical protein
MLNQTWFSTRRLQRIGAASAFAGFPLVVIANLGVPPPNLDSNATDIANLVIANQGFIKLATYADTLAAVTLFVFVIALISVAEPQWGFISRIAALTTAIFVALAFAAHGALFGVVQAATHNTDPVAVKAVFMVWEGLSIAEAIQFAFVFAALGLVVLSTRVLPIWLGWFAMALTIGGVVLSIATMYSGMPATRVTAPVLTLFGIWTLLAAALLLRRKRSTIG